MVQPSMREALPFALLGLLGLVSAALPPYDILQFQSDLQIARARQPVRDDRRLQGHHRPARVERLSHLFGHHDHAPASCRSVVFPHLWRAAHQVKPLRPASRTRSLRT